MHSLKKSWKSITHPTSVTFSAPSLWPVEAHAQAETNGAEIICWSVRGAIFATRVVAMRLTTEQCPLAQCPTCLKELLEIEACGDCACGPKSGSQNTANCPMTLCGLSQRPPSDVPIDIDPIFSFPQGRKIRLSSNPCLSRPLMLPQSLPFPPHAAPSRVCADHRHDGTRF